MKHLLSISILLAGALATSAAATINSTHKHAYGANIGWINSESNGADGDGVSDLNEHLADTNPLDPANYFRATFYSVAQGTGETNTLTRPSTPTRCYQVDYRTNLNAGSPWVDATGLFAPDPGAETTRVLALTPVLSQRYFRVEAIKPLSP